MTTPETIERRIRSLAARLPFCGMHGDDPEPIEQEIADLKAQLRELAAKPQETR